MKIHLHSDTDITVSRLQEESIDIDRETSDLHYGAMQMFVAAFAWCTFNVLSSYGQRVEADANDISLRLRWKYAEKPYRITHIDMAIRWPQLPASRLDAATRAAMLCTLHNSLQRGIEIDTRVDL